LVDYVVKKADEGATIEETYEYAENLKLSINHQFTVNDLFHLKRGGRVSSATAIVGTMLKVKPMLHVSDEGKLTTTGKVMRRQKSLRRLVENMQETADIAEGDPIFISHADCAADAEFVRELLKKSYPENPVFIHYIGPVIGSHAGCGTVALFFKSRKR
jgi:DegV family protein with EDD domain